MQGWIKLYRDLMDKPIWKQSKPQQKTILITLLLMANHNEKEWEFRGQKYKANPGQFVTSLDSIVENCGKGVSVQNVRTALKRFEKLEFLTNESTNKDRLITIVNWGLYQSEEENQQSNQQATNKQLTTNKNYKNIYINNSIFETYNSLNIVVHRKLTPKMQQSINKALKNNSEEEIIQAIKRYGQAYHDENYRFCSYKMTLDKFLTQGNGYSDWLDEGQKWINYSEFGNKFNPNKPSSDDRYNVNGR